MSSEELVANAEVVPPPAAATSLSPAMMQAAVVDASGATREEVARVAGVSVSSVKQWRQKPEYAAEIERLREANTQVLAEPVRRLREEIVDGARDAVKTLVDQLDATDARGRAANTIRQRAAELLLTEAAKMITEDATARAKAEAASVGGGPTTSITVNVGDKPPPVTVDT